MSGFIESLRSGEIMDARRLLNADPGLAQFREENGVSAVLIARYLGHRDFARELADAHPGIDIWEAAALGDIHRLVELLDAAPELIDTINADGYSPLGLAAYFGHLEVVQLLIARGAEVNVISQNPLGVMPIHSALSGGHQQIVFALIEGGSNVDDPSGEDWTPLHYVAESGNQELATALIDAGARSGYPRKDGKTALEVAEDNGFTDLAALLSRTLG